MGKIVKTIDGYKTYILSVTAIVVAFIGHFWGPIELGPVSVPEVSWSAFWAVAWKSSILASIRSALEKVGVPLPK